MRFEISQKLIIKKIKLLYLWTVFLDLHRYRKQGQNYWWRQEEISSVYVMILAFTAKTVCRPHIVTDSRSHETELIVFYASILQIILAPFLILLVVLLPANWRQKGFLTDAEIWIPSKQILKTYFYSLTFSLFPINREPLLSFNCQFFCNIK